MRRALFIVTVLASIAGVSIARSQCPILPAQGTRSPQGTCGGGGGSHGGGGGGGGATSGGALNFSSPSFAQNPTFVGGVSGREGPAVDSGFDGSLVSVAYTSTTLFDGSNDSYVYYGVPGSTQFSQVNVTNGVAASSANPTLRFAPVAGRPTLFMALNTGQVQSGQYGGLTGILSTTSTAQGAPWSYVVLLGGLSTSGPNYPTVSYSPSLASNSQYLFLGARNNADNTLVICRTDITVGIGATSCTNFPGSRAMSFNPSLHYWNNTLYIGFEELGNNHELRLFTSTDNGQTISENTNISAVNGDQSSTQPAFVEANSALYVGFRSNDGSQSFLYKWSADGINWTSSTNAGISIVSAPALAKTNTNLVWNFWGGNSNGGINLFLNTAAVQ